MATFEDITGQIFGRWTVVSRAETKGTHAHWNCICSCERKTIRCVRETHLISGNTKSCGCYAAELSSARRRVHGSAGTREYNAWSNARQRCIYPDHKSYASYGGRGIVMDQRWVNSFETFLADMGPCQDEFTLERIDNEGPYSPENCTWATQLDQCQNQRKTIRITHNGETMSLRQWARKAGMPYSTLRKRYDHGKPLFAPIQLDKSHSL